MYWVVRTSVRGKLDVETGDSRTGVTHPLSHPNPYLPPPTEDVSLKSMRTFILSYCYETDFLLVLIGRRTERKKSRLYDPRVTKEGEILQETRGY